MPPPHKGYAPTTPECLPGNTAKPPRQHRKASLATALGYSTWQKFNRVLNKALQVAQNRGMEMNEHFNQVVEMVRLSSGTFREVENFHLSRLACLIILDRFSKAVS